MTLFDPTATSAAVAAAAYIALLSGHQLGDHPIQSNADAAAKGHPGDDQLARGAHPWTGWTACWRHVASVGLRPREVHDHASYPQLRGLTEGSARARQVSLTWGGLR